MERVVRPVNECPFLPVLHEFEEVENFLQG